MYPTAVNDNGRMILTVSAGTADSVLRWQSGNSTVKSYNVYFGTDMRPDATELRGNVRSVFDSPTGLYKGNFNAGKLKANSHYWWRADPVINDAGDTIFGRLWDFWTDASGGVVYSQPTRIIFADHFESGATNVDPTASDLGWTRSGTTLQTRVAGLEGGKCVKMSRAVWLQKDISTRGMSGLNLTFHRSTTANQHFITEYSVDGGTFMALEDAPGTSTFAQG